MSQNNDFYKVPVEVEHLLTDTMQESLEEWRERSLSAVLEHIPRPIQVDGNTKITRLPAITSEKSDLPIGLLLPHQQAFTPAHAVRAALFQELIAPEHDVIVMANNGLASDSYRFNKAQRAILKNGDFSPFAEQQARTLVTLGISNIAITGYSLGARLAVELGSTDELEIVALNADEAPTAAGRSPKQLQKDFLASGGWGEQRAAIDDSGVLAVRQAYAPHKLAYDYAKFGIATLNPDNAAIKNAMQGSMAESLAKARRANPQMPIKLGRVAGSQLTDLSDIDTTDVTVRTYTGEAARKHATGDNPIAHALMAYDGLRAVLGK
jgi:pimeloyl-ACP methyl ester carboxylesterase